MESMRTDDCTDTRLCLWCSCSWGRHQTLDHSFKDHERLIRENVAGHQEPLILDSNKSRDNTIFVNDKEHDRD